MYVINNKFEIGEECFSVYRKPVKYTCPICEGEGSFVHNGHDIHCRNCNGSGLLHNAHQFVMDVCEVRVRRIVANIFTGEMTVKYKIDVVDDSCAKIKNRGEDHLFKTREEAEKYCEEVNV